MQPTNLGLEKPSIFVDDCFSKNCRIPTSIWAHCNITTQLFLKSRKVANLLFVLKQFYLNPSSFIHISDDAKLQEGTEKSCIAESAKPPQNMKMSVRKTM